MPQEEPYGMMTIFFIDGSKMRFSAPHQAQENWDAMRRLQSILDRPFLAFETEDGVVIVPTSNIKYIHASPKPVVFPEFFFRHTSLVDV